MRHGRRTGRERHVLARPNPEARANLEALRLRAREASQSQDEALYRCSCGFVFSAQVSTSVHCPHCDSTQAW
jgi:predicted Zn-ribbon and HTH transcriptional regulator